MCLGSGFDVVVIALMAIDVYEDTEDVMVVGFSKRSCDTINA